MYIFPLSSAALVLSSVHGWIFCLWPVGLHGFDVLFPADLEIHPGVGSGISCIDRVSFTVFFALNRVPLVLAALTVAFLVDSVFSIEASEPL